MKRRKKGGEVKHVQKHPWPGDVRHPELGTAEGRKERKN